MSAGLPLPTGEVPLTFGNTFTKNYKEESFHSIRYDFKPASVDTKKKGTVEIGDKYDITVTVPHVESSGTSETLFKGSKAPAAKECLLIFDQQTGKITLERISQRINVKKYRPETGGNKKTLQSGTVDNRKPSPSQSYSPSHPLSRGTLPSNSPSLGRPSPSHNSQKSSPNYKMSSHSQKSHSNTTSSGATSMPMLGFDDVQKDESVMSDSSSDSDSNSGSSSSSESDSDSEPEQSQSKDKSPSVFDDLKLSDED